jgi:hypothetical protein
MGSNKTFQQKGDRGRVLGESDEFRKLHRAIEKAHGDRDQAIRNVCRLYGVKASIGTSSNSSIRTRVGLQPQATRSARDWSMDATPILSRLAKLLPP